MRTATEIREHLIEQLSHALKRPGMYGGAAAIATFAYTLEFIDDGDNVDFVRIMDTNSRLGSGTVTRRLPEARKDVEATAFAPNAYRRGWLNVARVGRR